MLYKVSLFAQKALLSLAALMLAVFSTKLAVSGWQHLWSDPSSNQYVLAGLAPSTSQAAWILAVGTVGFCLAAYLLVVALVDKRQHE